MAWEGLADFQRKAGGKSEHVPCMTKMFGVPGCPQCAQARAAFDADDKEGGSQLYFKKQFTALVQMIECAEPARNNTIQLMQFPMRIVDEVIKRVSNPDADMRWPNPTDLQEGQVLVLSKDAGSAAGPGAKAYPVYSITMIAKKAPIPKEYWEQQRNNLPRMDQPLSCLRAFQSWPQTSVFIPSACMKEGTSVKFRLLPIPNNENYTPFGLLHMHYVPVRSKWDELWATYNYDPERAADVMAALGASGASADSDASPFGNDSHPGTPSGAPGTQAKPW